MDAVLVFVHFFFNLFSHLPSTSPFHQPLSSTSRLKLTKIRLKTTHRMPNQKPGVSILHLVAICLVLPNQKPQTIDHMDRRLRHQYKIQIQPDDEDRLAFFQGELVLILGSVREQDQALLLHWNRTNQTKPINILKTGKDIRLIEFADKLKWSWFNKGKHNHVLHFHWIKKHSHVHCLQEWTVFQLEQTFTGITSSQSSVDAIEQLNC